VPNYRRLFIPGGTYFFTVNLFDRRRQLLMNQVEALRESFGDVACDRPCVRRSPAERELSPRVTLIA